MRNRWLPLLIAAVAVLFPMAPALACGALVAPNGTIHLERATTFVAYHNGIEHYR